MLLHNSPGALTSAGAAAPQRIQRLAAACKALLEVSAQPGGLSALLPPADSQALPGHDSPMQRAATAASPAATAAAAALSPATRAITLLSRLATLCVLALRHLALLPETQALMAGPRPQTAAAAAATSPAAPAAAPIAELLLLLVSPDAWAWLGALDPRARAAAAGGAWTAQAAAAAVATRLLLGSSTLPAAAPPANSSGGGGALPAAAAGSGRGAPGWGRPQGSPLWRTVGRLLLLSLPAGGPAAGAGRPYVEVLTTQLVVRALGVKEPAVAAAAAGGGGGGGAALVLERQPPSEVSRLVARRFCGWIWRGGLPSSRRTPPWHEPL